MFCSDRRDWPRRDFMAWFSFSVRDSNMGFLGGAGKAEAPF